MTKFYNFGYIEVWYNRKRLHSALGYKASVEIETEFKNLKMLLSLIFFVSLFVAIPNPFN